MKITDIYKSILKEGLLDEEYPTSFDMEYFKRLTSFNARIKYCEQELTRISSGSSRIVYKIDDEKVLKLAKNKKGVEQNTTESSSSSGYECLAETFDSDDEDLWVEMELARPVKLSDFKPMLGLDLPTIGLYLGKYYFGSVNPNNKYRINGHFKEYAEEVMDWMWEDDFFRSILTLIGDYDIIPSDFARKSSYGIVKRDGVDTIVLIDFGITGSTYDSYYS